MDSKKQIKIQKLVDRLTSEVLTKEEIESIRKQIEKLEKQND